MATNSYHNVWDALTDTPEEALNLRLRSQLMIECSELVKKWNVPQKDAAKRLHITQPRLNDLLNGKIAKFSLDALVNLLGNANMSVELKVKPQKAQKLAFA